MGEELPHERMWNLAGRKFDFHWNVSFFLYWFLLLLGLLFAWLFFGVFICHSFAILLPVLASFLLLVLFWVLRFPSSQIVRKTCVNSLQILCILELFLFTVRLSIYLYVPTSLSFWKPRLLGFFRDSWRSQTFVVANVVQRLLSVGWPFRNKNNHNSNNKNWLFLGFLTSFQDSWTIPLSILGRGLQIFFRDSTDPWRNIFKLIRWHEETRLRGGYRLPLIVIQLLLLP